MDAALIAKVLAINGWSGFSSVSAQLNSQPWSMEHVKVFSLQVENWGKLSSFTYPFSIVMEALNNMLITAHRNNWLTGFKVSTSKGIIWKSPICFMQIMQLFYVMQRLGRWRFWEPFWPFLKGFLGFMWTWGRPSPWTTELPALCGYPRRWCRHLAHNLSWEDPGGIMQINRHMEWSAWKMWEITLKMEESVPISGWLINSH